MIRNAPKWYRVSMGAENTRFYAYVYIEFMYIEEATVLHMIVGTINFSADQFVEALIIESVWNTILTLWANVYTGFPDMLVFDGDSQLRDTFVDICEIYDVDWKMSGI